MLGRCALAVAALAVACGPDANERTKPDRATEPRIVALAPAASEMLVALGAEDRIVGIGNWVREPEQLLRLPRVGAYDTPNIERLIELGATLVVTADSQAAAAAHARLESLGVSVLALNTDTHEGIFRSLARLGAAIGREARARELGGTMRREIDRLRVESATLPRRRVLVVVGRDPLYAAGPGSHLDEMIRVAGGVNVLEDATSSYVQASRESVLARMPEVIIDLSDNRPGALRGRQAGEWVHFDFLPAVVENRVWLVDPQRLAIPGMRLVEMSRLVARLVHPEALGAPDPHEWLVPATRR